MRHFLERLAGYFPAVVALALPTAFLPTFATDAFILPRAAIVIAGACLGAGLAVLLQGGQNLGSMRWPLAASALAALLALGRAIQGGQYPVAWWMALPVLLAGLLVSTSRSGGLGVLAGCLVVLVFALRGRAAVAAGLASAAVIGLALLFILLSPLRLL